MPPIVVALGKHPLVDNYKFPHLKYLFSGAAPLGAELTEAVEKRLNIKIRQGYGMTEASPATHYTVAGEERVGTVGKLMPSTEGRIIDPETGKDVPTGQPGEVWVRGPQVMKGYLNNPEATAQTVDADGWLHTGDIGVMDDDGYLTVVDRLKELIKVKGFQVAPAELESLLLKHPKIADVRRHPGRGRGVRRSAEGDRRPEGPAHGRRSDGLPAAAGGALQARAPGGVRRRDSKVAVRKNPAADPRRTRARGGRCARLKQSSCGS